MKVTWVNYFTYVRWVTLARLPINERGFIGHEKQADDAWLIDNRIHFVISQAFPPVGPGPGPPNFNTIYFGDQARGRIVRYDDRIMTPLRDTKGVTFMPIEDVLARGRSEVLLGTEAQAREAYRQLERYYFESQSPNAVKAANQFRELLDSRL